MLFLSYAEEDGAVARRIAEWLIGHGQQVWYWQDPQRRGRRFVEEVERAIGDATAFIALLSPDFLASPWCRRERELAIHREEDLKVTDPDATFVHVWLIMETARSATGFLQAYDQVDLTGQLDDLDGALSPHIGRFGSRPELGSARPEDGWAEVAVQQNLASPLFRNRHDELERVMRGLTNAAGPHFWLVIAPPQLGKTWFLDRLTAQLTAHQPGRWAARLLDVADYPAETRANAAELLARLFKSMPAPSTESTSLRSIAQEIIRDRRSYLCLIDSAELLPEQVAATLRVSLSQIYQRVRDAGLDVRLAVVVASRQEDDWRGVTPDPRLSPVPLTEFNVEVVEDALHDLAGQMRRRFAAMAIRQDAALVHRLTEGLPALLVECLQWIRSEEWLDLDRLAGQELFENLAQPYIERGLLAPASLLPWPGGMPSPWSDEVSAERARRALEQAFRVLAPYRFFTRSHLRHHAVTDTTFSQALGEAAWSIEDLWRAISGTALLVRPLDEPWQELHPAIRRLLYRYYFRSDEDRAAAHGDAHRFIEVWGEKQSGKEQVIGLLECLWHDAMALGLTNQGEMAARLSESAAVLCDRLEPSSAYTTEELRMYAVSRMRNDEEFQDAVRGVDGLFAALIAILTPRGEPDHEQRFPLS